MTNMMNGCLCSWWGWWLASLSLCITFTFPFQVLVQLVGMQQEESLRRQQELSEDIALKVGFGISIEILQEESESIDQQYCSVIWGISCHES